MRDTGAPAAPRTSAAGETDARSVIVIARHGRPALDRSKPMGWREYKDWWAAYDAGGLATGQAPSDALRAIARDAHVVLASPLKRSQETAHALEAAQAVATEALLVEAPLPPPPIPGLKLKPGQWGVLARIAWWLGFSGGQESRRRAEARADEAVARLLAHVDEDAGAPRTVVVCAHGWFNRMMRPVLLARGWRCVVDEGDGYWSFRRYER